MAWRVRRLEQVFSDSLFFMLLTLCLAKGWFFPWYLTWLVPLAVAKGDRRWQQIVALYIALAPIMYTRYDGCVVGAILLHTAPLVLWWFDRRYLRSAGFAGPAEKRAETFAGEPASPQLAA